MKKVLSILLLFSACLALNAQTEVTFAYNNQSYSVNDTMPVTLGVGEMQMIQGIVLHNTTENALNGITATFEIDTLQSPEGMLIGGMCAGMNCLPQSTTVPFDIDANSDYTGFFAEIDVPSVHSGTTAIILFTIKSAGGDTLGKTTIKITINNSGIATLANAVVVDAYPNPAVGQATVKYNVNQPSTLVIYDALGHCVRKTPVCGEGNALLNNLPAGIYAYGILGNGQRSEMKKLVIQ